MVELPSGYTVRYDEKSGCYWLHGPDDGNICIDGVYANDPHPGLMQIMARFLRATVHAQEEAARQLRSRDRSEFSRIRKMAGVVSGVETGFIGDKAMKAKFRPGPGTRMVPEFLFAEGDDGPALRHCRKIRVNDEYQCSCGRTWDAADDEPPICPMTGETA